MPFTKKVPSLPGRLAFSSLVPAFISPERTGPSRSTMKVEPVISEAFLFESSAVTFNVYSACKLVKVASHLYSFEPSSGSVNSTTPIFTAFVSSDGIRLTLRAEVLRFASEAVPFTTKVLVE